MPTRAVLSFLLVVGVACGADATGAAGAIAAPKPSASASPKPAVQPAKATAVKPTTGPSAHKSRAVTAEDMPKVAPSEPGTTVHRVEVGPSDPSE
jgi:hypothetical protein